jgi:hypothetical protein
MLNWKNWDKLALKQILKYTHFSLSLKLYFLKKQLFTLLNGKFLLLSTAVYEMGWRVGVWLSDPKMLGLRKLRPHVELQSVMDRARALATEQKRNVQLDLAMTH